MERLRNAWSVVFFFAVVSVEYEKEEFETVV
jgi:hypothetical protein